MSEQAAVPINSKVFDEFHDGGEGGSLGKLDLSKIQKSTPNPRGYTKLMIDWPPANMIDASFVCHQCGLQTSPRSTTPVVPKAAVLAAIESESSTPRTAHQKASVYVEYSCNDCVNQLKSITSSPRLNLEFAPSSPSYSPREQSPRQMQRVERRRSITNSPSGSPILDRVKLRTRSSVPDGSRSPISSSPARGSSLRRSQTMNTESMKTNIAMTRKRQKEESLNQQSK